MDLVCTMQQQFLERERQEAMVALFQSFIQLQQTDIRATDITLTTTEQNLHEWHLLKYVDYGPNNRLGTCMCGRKLRYEFMLEHRLTKKRLRYGKTHLAQFLQLELKHIDLLIAHILELEMQLSELVMLADCPESIVQQQLTAIGKVEQYNLHYQASLHLPFHGKEQLTVGIGLRRDQLELLRKSTAKMNLELAIRNRQQTVYTPIKRSQDKPLLIDKNHGYILPDVSLPLPKRMRELIEQRISSALQLAHILTTGSFDVIDSFTSLANLKRPAIYKEIVAILLEWQQEGYISVTPFRDGYIDCHIHRT